MKTKKKLGQLKKRKSDLDVIILKISAADRKKILANAKRFAEGNMSAWLRHAGKVYTPEEGEKIALLAYSKRA